MQILFYYRVCLKEVKYKRIKGSLQYYSTIETRDLWETKTMILFQDDVTLNFHTSILLSRL